MNREELDHMGGGKNSAFVAKSFDELIDGVFIERMTIETCRKGELMMILKLTHILSRLLTKRGK